MQFRSSFNPALNIQNMLPTITSNQPKLYSKPPLIYLQLPKIYLQLPTNRVNRVKPMGSLKSIECNIHAPANTVPPSVALTL